MKVRRMAYAFAPIVVGAVVVATITSPVGAEEATETSAAAVLDALDNDPGLLAASASLPAQSDADSVGVSRVAGTTVDVPRDASDGVDLSAGGTSITITPPGAEAAEAGTSVAPGVTAYPSEDGAATAVQAMPNGGVRMLTVINDAEASTEYPYEVDVPSGGRIELTEDGGALVIDGEGKAIVGVPAPWAKDGAGVAVPTHFNVTGNGRTLVQVVDHQSSGVVYPVTADPFWNMLGNYLGCIFGVGVPIGVAVAIAMYPPIWPVVLGAVNRIGASGRVPAGAVLWYLERVRSACRAYFRG